MTQRPLVEKCRISGTWYVQYLLIKLNDYVGFGAKYICKILLLHVRYFRWTGKYVEIVK